MARFTGWLLAYLLILTGCQPSLQLENIILSYSEDDSSCLNCPSFRVDFRAGGHVNYECLRGCPAPGEHHHLVPSERFPTLVRAFQEESFFHIARTDPSRFVFDVPVFRLTYRDERRIHEVVDDNRQDQRLRKLETQFKALTEVDHFQKPSVSLYRTLLNEGWDVNTLGRDHQNALSTAVLSDDLESARFPLQHGSAITRLDFLSQS